MTRQRTSASSLAAAQMIVFAIALALLLLPGATSASQIPIQACCTLLLLHSLWSIWSWWRASGSLFHPYLMFLLSTILFNAGLALLEVFGLNGEPLLEEFSPDVVLRSLLLVLAALAGLHLGALLACSPERDSNVGESPASRPAMRITGLMLLAIAFLPLLRQLRQVVSLAASGGYMALYQQTPAVAGVGSALDTGADLALAGVCFILIGGAGWRLDRFVALALLAIYFSALLFAGSRGQSTLPLVSAAWVWDRTIRRIPRSLIAVVAAILVSVVFPFVRQTRELPADERTAASAASPSERPPSGVEEMGGSIVTIAYTVELVPEYRPYDRGVGFAYALLTVVPSLFWNRHPYVARGTPSDWLIEMVDPFTAKEGGGLGFSFIADAFLNFGALGVPLVALLMGYGIVRLCRWADRSSARLAVVATFMPYLLFTARSEIVLLPRALLWYGFGPYALYCVVRRAIEESGRTRSGCGPLNRAAQEIAVTPGVRT